MTAQAVPPALPLMFPVPVIIDTREGLPFALEGLTADAEHGHRPIVVTKQRKALPAGDYSLLGHERDVTIERKSLSDLYSTLGQQRERFERELRRIQDCYQWGAVVIEADWPAIIRKPPERSYLKSKTVFRSILTWAQRYPKVHWFPCPDRRFAEILTFRLLERWLKDRWPKGAKKLYAEAAP
jgi:ERCC4-type nuclease